MTAVGRCEGFFDVVDAKKSEALIKGKLGVVPTIAHERKSVNTR